MLEHPTGDDYELIELARATIDANHDDDEP